MSRLIFFPEKKVPIFSSDSDSTSKIGLAFWISSVSDPWKAENPILWNNLLLDRFLGTLITSISGLSSSRSCMISWGEAVPYNSDQHARWLLYLGSEPKPIRAYFSPKLIQQLLVTANWFYKFEIKLAFEKVIILRSRPGNIVVEKGDRVSDALVSMISMRNQGENLQYLENCQCRWLVAFRKPLQYLQGSEYYKNDGISAKTLFNNVHNWPHPEEPLRHEFLAHLLA